jgi:nucleoside-triphosphatase THEP1
VDKVQVDLHVLRALMLHGIGGEVDRADVIEVDESGALEGLWSSWRSWHGQEASA